MDRDNCMSDQHHRKGSSSEKINNNKGSANTPAKPIAAPPDEIDIWMQELFFPSERLHDSDLRTFTNTLEKNIYQNIFNVYPLNYICDMRPLVRSEQIRLRMPKDVKQAIKEKANHLGITVTAYLERLVLKDLDQTLLTKEEIISKE